MMRVSITFSAGVMQMVRAFHAKGQCHLASEIQSESVVSAVVR